MVGLKGLQTIPEETTPHWDTELAQALLMTLEKLKYPIGRFKAPETISAQDRNRFINDLQHLPKQIKDLVSDLNNQQLDTPYRPGGWTIRQVVHHLPDSHLNSYIRFKWALTEPQPLIKAYHEDLWAELPDGSQAPVELSLSLLDSLHLRWVWLLQHIKEEDWKRCFIHPETNKLVPLDVNLSLYSWHGKHHLAHIQSVITTQNW